MSLLVGSDEYNTAVQQLTDLIQTYVNTGKSLEEARRAIASGYNPPPEALIEAAVSNYTAEVNGISLWPGWDSEEEEAGASVLKEPGTSWYSGPAPHSVFWPPLKARLKKEIPAAVPDIDASSSRIVSLGAPPGAEIIDTRGLVLGYVQSGKTTSFMSVITKSADIGYRLIIVLSGITDNLRQQTQDRLHDYIVSPKSERFNLLTTSENDFQEKTNPTAILNTKDLRHLAIIKKNPARLRRLKDWLSSVSKTTIAQLPILIIDDEADQASIDVGNKRRSTINGLIRDILAHPKAAYVAYTATPFANLLIDPSDESDLYPRTFVVTLPRPEAYFGPERIFGSLDAVEGEAPDDGLDIVRFIPDEDVEIARPPRSKAEVEDWVAELPETMRTSVLWFLMATTARRIRSARHRHSSMLIHTSMRARAHVHTAETVDDLLRDVRAAVQNHEHALRQELSQLWQRETTALPPETFGHTPVDFDEIWGRLPDTLARASVIVDNYLSQDRLEYDDQNPATTIVVGGNTLSRGLTLEGLISSYFVRAASAYDTLLQMGRWFGYRGGYEDLVRIWMTPELHGWFIDLSTVEAEIRREIEVYAKEGKTPKDLPVRIRTHPQMAVTSAAKMRSAVRAKVGFSGHRVQTILFYENDLAWLENNQDAVTDLVRKAKKAGHTEHELGQNILGFKNLPAKDILAFLKDYRVHADAQTFNQEAMSKYIRLQNKKDRLKAWDLVFITRSNGDPSELTLGLDEGVRLLRRKKMSGSPRGTANLKAITSRMDRGADLGLTPGEVVEECSLKVPSSKVGDEHIVNLRYNRGDARGVVAIYPISARSGGSEEGESDSEAGIGKARRIPLSAAAHLIGVAVFFPKSPDSEDTVDYIAAPVPMEYLEDVDEELMDADELDEKAAEAEEVE